MHTQTQQRRLCNNIYLINHRESSGVPLGGSMLSASGAGAVLGCPDGLHNDTMSPGSLQFQNRRVY